MHRSRFCQRGSTIIEVIIAIAVVALVLVTIAASGTIVTRNQRFSERQAIATKYTQEAVEWAKNMRQQMGWQTLVDTVVNDGGSGGATYCLVTLPSSAIAFDALSAGVCQSTDVIVGTEFTRSMRFEVVSSSEIKAIVTVNWTDNATDHQTKAEAVLKQWL